MCAFFGWRGERTSTRTPRRPETLPRPVITTWPVRPDELVGVQVALGQATPPPWSPPASPPRIGGCFVCFARGIAGAGEAGDPAFAAAAVLRDRRVLARAVVRGAAGAPYLPALLALREAGCWRRPCAPWTRRARPRCCWSTPPGVTIHGAPGWRCTWGRCWVCPRSV